MPNKTRHNPLLDLPAAKALKAQPLEVQAHLATLLRQLASEADELAELRWSQRKGPMASYWRVVSTYATHAARMLFKPRRRRIPRDRLRADWLNHSYQYKRRRSFVVDIGSSGKVAGPTPTVWLGVPDGGKWEGGAVVSVARGSTGRQDTEARRAEATLKISKGEPLSQEDDESCESMYTDCPEGRRRYQGGARS